MVKICQSQALKNDNDLPPHPRNHHTRCPIMYRDADSCLLTLLFPILPTRVTSHKNGFWQTQVSSENGLLHFFYNYGVAGKKHEKVVFNLHDQY